MISKQYQILLFIILFPFLVFGQVSNDPSMLIIPNSFGTIRTFQPDPRIEGEYLEFPAPIAAQIFLNNKTAPKLDKANIDLINQTILAEIRDGTYAIEASLIDSVHFQEFKLINRKHIGVLSKDGEKEVLVFELFSGDKFLLYKETKMFLVEPTYNEALDVGNRNYTLKRKDSFQLFSKGDNQVLEVKKVNDFKGYATYKKIKTFVKANKIDFKTDEGMVRLVQFLDEL